MPRSTRVAGAALAVPLAVVLAGLAGCDDASIPTPGGGDQRVEVGDEGLSVEIPDGWSALLVTRDGDYVARAPDDRQSITVSVFPTAERAERLANESARELALGTGVTCLRKADTALGGGYPVTDCQRPVGARTLRTVFVPVREQAEPPSPEPTPSDGGTGSSGASGVTGDVGDAGGSGDGESADSGDLGSASTSAPSSAPPPAPSAAGGRSVLLVFQLYGLRLTKIEPTLESVVESLEFEE